MKRTIIIFVILLSIGMPVFAQMDISFYIHEYNRSDATVFDMLDLLRAVRDEERADNENWYYNAITVFIQKLPNFQNSARERFAIEECSRIMLRGLAAEKNDKASYQIWQLLEFFNISSYQNDGFLMFEAIVALGQVNARDYLVPLADLLTYYNERRNTDAHSKTRMQRVVPALFAALETLNDPYGVRPLFFATIGWYSNDINAQASSSLTRLMDSLGEVIGDIIIAIIQDPFNGPLPKNAAWQELLRTHVSETIKAKVAVAALEASYTFVSQSYESRILLRTMRMTSIDVIRAMGIQSDNVYAFLERAYREAFDTPNTDFEEIILVVRTLTAAKTDQAIDLLTEFLRWIHSRRQSGPWTHTEREIMYLLIQAIGSTGTQSRTALQLLFTISHSSMYTEAEQNLARDAINNLSRR